MICFCREGGGRPSHRLPFIRKNKKIIPVPDKNVIPVPPLPALTEDEREELEQLSVENACLKKLKALVQQNGLTGLTLPGANSRRCCSAGSERSLRSFRSVVR